MSLCWAMDKQIRGHPCGGTLSSENGRPSAAHHRAEKPQRAAVREGSQAPGFHAYDVLQRGKLQGQKAYPWSPEAGGGQKGGQQRGTREGSF